MNCVTIYFSKVWDEIKTAMQEMTATLVWQNDKQFLGTTGSDHNVLIDGNRETNSGASPMELVLMGMGGCSAYDVVHILEKSRQNVTKCVTELTAKRSSEIPAVFTDIHIHFVVAGEGLADDKVARAVALSAEKYCSASIMLARGGVNVTHSHELHDDN